MKKNLLVLAVAMSFLAGCGEDKPTNPVPPGVFATQAAAPTPAAAPVIINQAPAHSGGDTMTGALAGAALGYALGSAGRNDNPRYYDDRRYGYDRPTQTTINKTVIVKQYVKEAPKPTVQAVPTTPLVKSVPVTPSKVIPAAPSPVTPTVAKKLSLDKPSVSKSSSFSGFSRRK